MIFIPTILVIIVALVAIKGSNKTDFKTTYKNEELENINRLQVHDFWRDFDK